MARLCARPPHVIKLGLECITELLDRLGRPQAALPAIHVAGTNGKGSVCAMLDAVLRAAGLRVGLYTSPHLVRFNERIRVNGVPIDDAALAELLLAVEVAEGKGPGLPGGRAATFFEFTTALAFEHFRRMAVEIAVLETGLGGRLDATNVVTPLVSVITRLGMEHTALLGNTLEQIAGEKAGIIKPGRPVVYAGGEPEPLAVIQDIAGRLKAPLILAPETVAVRRMSQDIRGQKIALETASGAWPPARLPLIGRHQLENVAVAVAALEALQETTGIALAPEVVARGLESVGWPARCQLLEEDPPLLLDSAHNPQAAAALAGTLREVLAGRPLGLVFGLLADKDAAGFLGALAPLVRRGWVVPLPSERNMPLDRLRAAARAAGMEVGENTLADALAEARPWARREGGLVCVAGSLVLAGEVLKARESTP